MRSCCAHAGATSTKTPRTASIGSAPRHTHSTSTTTCETLLRDSRGRPTARSWFVDTTSRKGKAVCAPLGSPAIEDTLVQLAVTRILEAIYEQDFLRCSYGYRPHVGALDAIRTLTIKLQFGRYKYVVEADIKGFFDNLDHDWLLKMLAERIADKALLRLIKKWLKAGVLDMDGQGIHPATGTPQGGIVSPILANVYLHYALDLWFEKVVKKRCQGEACLLRYADDCAPRRREGVHMT